MTGVRPPRPFGWPDEEEPFGDLTNLAVEVVETPSRGRRFSRAVGTNTGTTAVVREGYVPFGGGALALPERYGVTIDDPRWPVCHLEVSVEDGAPRCSAVRCRRRDGEPPLTRAVLAAIPIAFFLKKSAAAAAVRCT